MFHDHVGLTGCRRTRHGQHWRSRPARRKTATIQVMAFRLFENSLRNPCRVAERRRTLASHNVAGFWAKRNRLLKGGRRRPHFPTSLRDEISWNDDQPPCGWLISLGPSGLAAQANSEIGWRTTCLSPWDQESKRNVPDIHSFSIREEVSVRPHFSYCFSTLGNWVIRMPARTRRPLGLRRAMSFWPSLSRRS